MFGYCYGIILTVEKMVGGRVMQVKMLGVEAKEEIDEKVNIVKKFIQEMSCSSGPEFIDQFILDNELDNKRELVTLYEFVNRVFNVTNLKEADYSFLASLLNRELLDCILKLKVRVVTAAGRISRTTGTVSEVYEKCNNHKKNVSFTENIITNYGHKSIAEHDYIVLGLENVTPIIEQSIIEYRLTSFTIKSRRNVDFRNVGFYVPEFKDKNGNVLSNNEELQDTYKKYMQSLFDKYGQLVDEGLPVEDSRYILPYSYYSNIIMGCDAHELVRITSDMLYGKLSHISELKDFGNKLKGIISEWAPYLIKDLEAEEKKSYYKDNFEFLDDKCQEFNKDGGNLLEKPEMTNFTENADNIVLCNILMGRYQMSKDKAEEVLAQLMKDNPNIAREMMQALLRSKNQRELEQVIFSFETPISLAVLTHISRHRTHSLLVPDFVPLWNLENYITPKSVAASHEKEYQEIFRENALMVEYFKSQGVREEDLVYFYLSGNACNIFTTMNGRTIEWFSRMRCCNKAQWEINNIAKVFVENVKSVAPLIGECLGSSCDVLGVCPEGKDSCKARGVVVKKLVKKENE